MKKKDRGGERLSISRIISLSIISIFIITIFIYNMDKRESNRAERWNRMLDQNLMDELEKEIPGVDPNNLEEIRAITRFYFKKGDTENMERYLRILEEQGGITMNLLHLKGVKSFLDYDYDSAADLFMQSLIMDPFFIPNYEYLVVSCIYSNRHEECIDFLEVGFEIRPEDINVISSLAVLFTSLNRFDETENIFQGIDIFQNQNVFSIYARNVYLSEDYNRTIDILENYTDTSLFTATNILLGLGYELRYISEKDPIDRQRYLDSIHRGFSLGERSTGRYHDFFRIRDNSRDYDRIDFFNRYNESRGLGEDDFILSQVAYEHINRWQDRKEDSDLMRAKELIDKAMMINNKSIHALFVYARYHSQEPTLDLEKAIASLEELIGIYPRHAAALTLLSTLYLKHTDDLEKASDYAYSSISVRDDRCLPFMVLATVEIRKGNLDQSEEFLTRALESQVNCRQRYLDYIDLYSNPIGVHE